MSEEMTKADRNELIRLVKSRARLAKSEAEQRKAVLLAEVEDLMAAEFEARDEMWSEGVKVAEEATRKANDLVQAQCETLGIPPRYAPKVQVLWSARSSQFRDPDRRGELRKVAQARLDALTKTAKQEIDKKALETETELVAGGLESSDARAFLEAMPTAEQLMPALGLDDLGVKHWQPQEGAAAALVTPSTTADRKRRQVLRAIEANPDASSRRIAEIAGVDHKTVAKYRAERGEIPSGNGEFPTDADGGGVDG